MPETTFLKFKDDNGVTADGHLEPLVEIGLVIPVAVMILNPATKKEEPGEAASEVRILPADSLEPEAVGMSAKPARIVPGTRLVEVADYRIGQALLKTHKWEQVDPPTRTETRKQAEASKDAKAEAGTHDDNDRAGDGQED